MSGFLRHTWDLLLKGGLAVTGFLSGIGRGDNRIVILLLVLMVLDYISGIAAAVLRKSRKTKGGGLSSAAGWHGLLKKGMMLLVVALGYVLDALVGQQNAMFQSAVTWFYISNECISLLENLALSGIPIPKTLRNALERLGDEVEQEQENLTQNTEKETAKKENGDA